MKQEGPSFNNESNPYNIIERMEGEIKTWTSILSDLKKEYDSTIDKTTTNLNDSNVQEQFELNIKLKDIEEKITKLQDQIDTNNDQIQFLTAKSMKNN